VRNGLPSLAYAQSAAASSANLCASAASSVGEDERCRSRRGPVPPHRGPVPPHRGPVPPHRGPVPPHRGQVPPQRSSLLADRARRNFLRCACVPVGILSAGGLIARRCAYAKMGGEHLDQCSSEAHVESQEGLRVDPQHCSPARSAPCPALSRHAHHTVTAHEGARAAGQIIPTDLPHARRQSTLTAASTSGARSICSRCASVACIARPACIACCDRARPRRRRSGGAAARSLASVGKSTAARSGSVSAAPSAKRPAGCSALDHVDGGRRAACEPRTWIDAARPALRSRRCVERPFDVHANGWPVSSRTWPSS
jgi:hypothetical protein